MSKRTLGYIAVVLSAAGYGISWVFVKWLYQYTSDPMQLLALRYLIAVPVMWILLLIMQRGKIGLSRRAIPGLIALGVLNAITETALAWALLLLDASLVSVLFYTYPVIVSGLAIVFFSESMNKFRGIALVLIITGTILVAQLNPFIPLKMDGLGLILALTGSLVCAAFTMSTQSVSAKTGPVLMTTMAITIAAIILQFIKPPVYLFDGSMDWSIFPMILALAVFCTAAPLFFFVTGVSLVRASNASIAATLEPVVAVVSAFFILSERMVWTQILGVLAIISAIVVLQLQREPKSETEDLLGVKGQGAGVKE